MGRRIGILGGTFDPIHNGHLIVAQEVVSSLELDRILFVPCGQPPHKQYPEMASAEARAEMVRLGVADNPLFEFSPLELQRPGKSYTIETLRELREQFGLESEIYLVIGADNAGELSSWCDPEGVLETSRVAVVLRDGFDRSRIDPAQAERMTFLDTPRIEISSTDIRSRVCRGFPIRYLVPEKVGEYIREEGLYR